MEKDTERVIISVFPIKKAKISLLPVNILNAIKLMYSHQGPYTASNYPSNDENAPPVALRNVGPDLRQTDRQTDRETTFIYKA